MELERRSRSEDTFENKYLFILATHNNTSSYKQKQSAEGAFLVEEDGIGYCAPL
jgi:hypothetical protein